MFHGKMKAVTFSYDDGVTEDERLIRLFDRYGLKATFNLNSGLMDTDRRIPAERIRECYRNHEVAAHTLTHPNLREITDDAEVIRQVEEDRRRLGELCGYEITGLAYPCGGYCFDDRVIGLVREHTGIRYARTAGMEGSFELPEDLLEFHPTVFHCRVDQMFALAERFLAMEADHPLLFSVWGHSYEFGTGEITWEKMEEFCRLIGGREDIFYGTCREVLLPEGGKGQERDGR